MSVSTPVRRPTWLKFTALLASVGVVTWPILAMLGLIGAVPAQAVLNAGIVTAFLAYISIRRIKLDREIAMGASGHQPDSPQPPPDDAT